MGEKSGIFVTFLTHNKNNTEMKHERTKAIRSVGTINNSLDHVSGSWEGMNQHRKKAMMIMGKRSGETIEHMHRGKGVT